MSLLLILLFISEPIRINLQTLGRLLERWDYSQVQRDGSVIYSYKNTVLHFSKEGELIQKIIRRKGHPEAFKLVMEAYWLSNHYLIHDHFDESIKILDSHGQMLKRVPVFMSGFQSVGKDFFARVYKKDHRFANSEIVRVSFNSDFELELGKAFHFQRPEIKFTSLNNGVVHLLENGDLFFVVDETVNELVVYSPCLKETRRMSIKLDGFVRVRKQVDFGKTRPELEAALNTYSTISKIASNGQHLVFQYTAPAPMNPKSMVSWLQITDLKGRPIKKREGYSGHFLGAHRNHLYFIEEPEPMEYQLVLKEF